MQKYIINTFKKSQIIFYELIKSEFQFPFFYQTTVLRKYFILKMSTNNTLFKKYLPKIETAQVGIPGTNREMTMIFNVSYHFFMGVSNKLAIVDVECRGWSAVSDIYNRYVEIKNNKNRGIPFEIKNNGLPTEPANPNSSLEPHEMENGYYVVINDEIIFLICQALIFAECKYTKENLESFKNKFPNVKEITLDAKIVANNNFTQLSVRA